MLLRGGPPWRFIVPGWRTARWRLFWRWLHAGRFHRPGPMEAALAAWPDLLWAGPPGTLPRELRPPARRRQWARRVMEVEAARCLREAAELQAAGWTLHRVTPPA